LGADSRFTARSLGDLGAIHRRNFGRFTVSLSLALPLTLTSSPAVWVTPLGRSLTISLSLARLVSLSHSPSLAHSLPLTLSLSLPTRIQRASFSLFLFFCFFLFLFLMNRFGGRFAIHRAQFGRFTGATLGDSLSLSLARSPSYTHQFTGSLGHAARSFAHCLSVSRSLSLPLTLTLARSQSPSHSLSRSLETSPKAAYLSRKLPPRPRISAGNFPQGRVSLPQTSLKAGLDAQIRSERKKKNRRIQARSCWNPARYRWNHC
jgi:hypothetical protein